MFELKQSLFLLITASIWGSSFVAQSIGNQYVEPLTYVFFRTIIGAMVLTPIVLLLHKIKAHKSTEVREKIALKPLIIGSWVCGLFLYLGECLQQYGLLTTDAGKAGFLTSMYIVFVPLLGLAFGKKLNVSIVIGVMLSLVGLYLLCIKESFTLQMGDLLVLSCAVVFAIHILFIDRYLKFCDGLMLACGQYITGAIMGFIVMMIVDGDVFSWSKVWDASLALLWSGVMGNGIAYTFQILGQRGLHPSIATLILSTESVLAVIFGMIILDETLTLKESIGCATILCAVIIAQLNFKVLISLFKNKAQSHH